MYINVEFIFMNDKIPRHAVFTWRNGTWVSIRDNGLIYYSEKIRNNIMTEDISFVTYNIADNHILSITPHKNEPDKSYFSKLSYKKSGARTFAKKKLNEEGYILPNKSMRFYAEIEDKLIKINISSLHNQ